MNDDATDPAARMAQLVTSLPALRDAPGARPWNPLKIDAWAATGIPSHGERCAAQFVLAVWNPDVQWNAGKFDVMDALSVWDPQHHYAFLQWVIDPWWA